MKAISKFFLSAAFGLAVFGAAACSDDDSSSASANDGGKTEAADFDWADVQVFDAKTDLPGCSKFKGVAQVIDEKAFFSCEEGKWVRIGVTAPSYDELPKCDAKLNDFCVDIADGADIQESYVCGEGEWVKGLKDEDGVGCLKGDDNISLTATCGRGCPKI